MPLIGREGEGNGNPRQCPCLENARDGGAWWAAVYGVAQSRTRLKRLSSSSNKERREQDFLFRYENVLELHHSLKLLKITKSL